MVIGNTALDELPSLSPTLKHLYLEKNYQMTTRTLNTPFNLSLESLSIAHSYKIDAAGLFELVKKSNEMRTLKHLDLGGRHHDSHTNIASHYPPSSTVQFLGLSSIPSIRDKEITEIIGLYPNLQKVDLAGTAITGVGLKYAVTKGITSINVDGCERLGEDAVLWARAQGVEVQYSMMRPNPPPQRFRDRYADRY